MKPMFQARKPLLLFTGHLFRQSTPILEMMDRMSQYGNRKWWMKEAGKDYTELSRVALALGKDSYSDVSGHL